jgi:hypothetical protein
MGLPLTQAYDKARGLESPFAAIPRDAFKGFD